jgi:diaminohydroxyphosphoribosylaminopyrimidine deaminase/5-amino-6-(5-phosphoribosylamino)uracil reductase
MKRVLRGRPWVTVKRALTEGGSMLPPPGLKTFTSLQSLRLAHLLRRRADAILTGSGTILADQPEFTVRHLQDHVRGPRQLIIADRSGRVSQQASHYLEQARQRGFEVVITTDWRSEMARLSERGVMEILVEAGPSLSADVLAHEDWDEHWVIQKTAGEEDQVTCIYRESLKS